MASIAQINLDKRKITIGLGVIATIAGMAYGAYAYLPMATGGGYNVTHRDVSAYRNAMVKLVEITGEGDVPSREDSLKAIAATYAQYDLLKKKGMQINQDKVNALIESQSPLKGVLKQMRSSLGEERYYYTVTLPAAIGRPFADYYSATDPKAQDARNVLQNAVASSLSTAAEKAGLKFQDITITNSEDAAMLFDAASKSIGKPIDKIIDSGNSYLIVQPRERLDNKIFATAVLVPKTPPAEFFMTEIKKANVALKVKPWCLYADNKFFAAPAPPTAVDTKQTEGAGNEQK